MFLVSKFNPKATEDATWRDFIEETLIFDMWDEETQAETRKRIHRVFKILGFTSKKTILLPNRESVYASVEMNNGVTIGGNSISNATNSGKIRKYDTGQRTFTSCIWRSDHPQSEQIRKFCDCLKEQYMK